MKKLTLCAVIISALFSQSINAQDTPSGKGIYFKVNGGYNIPISNTQMVEGFAPLGSFLNETEISSTATKIEVVDINLGKGINFGGTVGYMFNDRLGAEIESSYLLGGETEANKKYLDGDYEKTTISSKMFQIKPAFVLSVGYSKINPYAKLGVILGVGKINQEYTEYNGNLTNAEVESKGGLAFGFHGGIGLNFSLSSNLSLFSELNINNLTYAPKEGEITKYTVNGVNLLPESTVRDREIEYVDETISDGSSDPNRPSKAPKTSFAYGTLGINIGLKYSL